MAKCKLASVVFTKRENELFCLLKEGNTRKEASEIMFVSCRTVDTYLQLIYGKLGVKKLVEVLSFQGQIQVTRQQKSASTENKNQVQQLLMNGLLPKEISKQMQIGIISIYTWRKELKEQGKLPKLAQRQPLFSCLKYIQSQNQTIKN